MLIIDVRLLLDDHFASDNKPIQYKNVLVKHVKITNLFIFILIINAMLREFFFSLFYKIITTISFLDGKILKLLAPYLLKYSGYRKDRALA